MIRFYKRLQVYVLSSLLIIITLWILVPHTRSQNISRLSIRRSLPPPDENNNIIRNEEDRVEFSDADLEPLRNLFKETDTTADGLLSLNELTWGIQKSVSKHVQSAMRNNFKNFFRLDRINHNGQVEWDEWLSQFYHENGIKKKQDLSNTERSVKEKLAAAKAAWSEAARSNPDALNIDEFLAFTHPESSHSILAQQTEETLGRFDGDGDGVITLEEYISDPYIEFTPDELKDRQKLFHTIMDADGNGKVDRRELITYLDPKHPSQSKEEAFNLIALADQDGDGYLSWPEVKAFASDVYQSKWSSPEIAFHGEF